MKKKLTLVLLVFHLCAHPQTVLPYNIIISEIMADPSPAVGLPSTEFIELRNTSSRAINLNGWQIADAGNTAVITIHFILQPDSMVIICANTAMSALAAFGAVAGVSNFPSLDNEGDLLSLRSKEGNIIHAVIQTNEIVSEEELRNHLASRLVPYKIPRSFEFTDEPLRDEADKMRRSAIRQARIDRLTRG